MWNQLSLTMTRDWMEKAYAERCKMAWNPFRNLLGSAGSIVAASKVKFGLCDRYRQKSLLGFSSWSQRIAAERLWFRQGFEWIGQSAGTICCECVAPSFTEILHLKYNIPTLTVVKGVVLCYCKIGWRILHKACCSICKLNWFNEMSHREAIMFFIHRRPIYDDAIPTNFLKLRYYHGELRIKVHYSSVFYSIYHIGRL